MVVASTIAALFLAGGAGAHVFHGQPTKDIALYAGGAATAALAALAFVDRLADFSQRFAEAVYRDFYVAHKAATPGGGE
jgi:ABC-type proline/glycine betaine transport system permease subunit